MIEMPLHSFTPSSASAADCLRFRTSVSEASPTPLGSATAWNSPVANRAAVCGRYTSD